MATEGLIKKHIPTFRSLGKNAFVSVRDLGVSAKKSILPLFLAAPLLALHAAEPVSKKVQNTVVPITSSIRTNGNYLTDAINAAQPAIQRTVDQATAERVKVQEEKKAATEEKKAATEEKKAATEEKKAATEEKKAATEEKKAATQDLKTYLQLKHPGLSADQIIALYPTREAYLRKTFNRN